MEAVVVLRKGEVTQGKQWPGGRTAERASDVFSLSASNFYIYTTSGILLTEERRTPP